MASHRYARPILTVPLAVLVILPLLSFAATEASVAARLLVLGLMLVAGLRPAHALLLCAALTPLSTLVGALLHASVPLTEPFVLAFLGGWLLHESARNSPAAPGGQAITAPALLFAVAVVASCAVQLIALQAATDHPWLFLRQVAGFLARGYFSSYREYPSITASALLLEGVALCLAVATLCRRDPTLGGKAARMAAAGGAGVAALNIYYVAKVSLQSGRPIAELAAWSTMLRTSWAFPDVNAAGSYLALVVLLSSGALGTKSVRSQAGWVVATLLMLGALWLTGSRAAIFAALAVAVLVLAVRLPLAGRSWIRPAVAGVLVLVLVALAIPRISGSLGRPLSVAVDIRIELTRMGLKMFATHPVFGVGVGRYYALSSEFASPELLRWYPRENAHNNFLQILAELGIVGLALFLWILLAVFRSVWPGVVPGRASPMLIGTTGGLIAFLLTCLSGHPLLIPQVACAFWLVLGVAVGLAPEPVLVKSPARDRRRWSWRGVVAGAGALVLVISVPVRARQLISDASIGRPSEGLSEWQTDNDGTMFRWFEGRAQFPIPAATRAVTLPLRLDAPPDAGTIAVEIYLDSQLVSRVYLGGDDWREFRFLVPPAPPGVHFRRIELQAWQGDRGDQPAGRPRTAAAPRIRIGQLKLARAPG